MESDSLLLPPIEEERGDDPEIVDSTLLGNDLEQKLGDEQNLKVSDEEITATESRENLHSEGSEDNNGMELRIETDEEYEFDDDIEDRSSDSYFAGTGSELEGSEPSLALKSENDFQEQSEINVKWRISDISGKEQENSELISDEFERDIVNRNSSVDEQSDQKEPFIASSFNKFLHLQDENDSLIVSDEDEDLEIGDDSLISDSQIIDNLEIHDGSPGTDEEENIFSSFTLENNVLDGTSGTKAREDNSSFMGDILENVIDNTFATFDKKTQDLEDSIRLAKSHRRMEIEKTESEKKMEKERKKAKKRVAKRSFLWKSEESKLVTEIESLMNQRKKDVIERATLKPFTLVNAHGYNKDLRILCLNVKGDIQLGLACSHSCMLYSVLSKKVIILQGHRNLVSCLCNEPTGQWLASADIGPDNSIVIWDLINGFPLHTIFSPHQRGTRRVAFTSDSQYLLSVTAGQEQVLMIWRWSKGDTFPEATLLLPTDCDCSPIRRLDTDPDHAHYLMCTFDDRTVFVTYNANEKRLHQHFPKEDRKLKVCGQFTSSTYGLRTHLAYTATTKGYVVLWSDVSFEKSFKTDSGTNVSNNKEYIEIIRLKNWSINEIKCVQDRRRLIVIADEKGVISFYDITLRLLFWCQESLKQPLNFVELCPQRLKKNADPKRVSWPRGYQEFGRGSYISNVVTSDGASKCANPGVTKIFSKIFLMKMFIVATKSGDIFKMECEEQEYKKIFSATLEPMTSIACHTNKDFIYVGTQNGVIYLYDFINQTVLVETTVKEDKREKNWKCSVTSIGIGNLGLELAVGLEDGSLHFHDSVLLAKQESFNNSKTAIRNIVFDKNCNYLAHLDDEKSVSLYSVSGKKIFLGRYQSHYENVTDLVFTDKNSNLVSIGEDGKLATYFLGNDGDDIEISVSETMNERARPLTLVPYYKPEGIIVDKIHGEEFVLLANSKFKFQICSTLTKECVKTLQAPYHSSPVRFMKILPPDYVRGEKKPKYLVYATNNEIGLHSLPIDGNPYKCLAVLGSPTKIQQMSVSSDNRYLFTLSEYDDSLLIWEIDPLAVQLSAFYGGTGLQPYYSMLEGGRDGWLMNEIKDYFYYFQLVHEGELMMSKREVSNRIHLCDLFEFLNSVGYFPSTSEKASIYSEVRRRHHGKTDHQITLDFDFVVQLYLNHKPTLGIRETEVRKAFTKLAKQRSNPCFNKSPASIDKTAFIAMLAESGQELTTEEIRTILSTLTSSHPQSTTSREAEQGYEFLPSEITYNFFLEELMGLEIETNNQTHNEKDTISSTTCSNSLISETTTTVTTY
ncbi:cilia- and flagella-associated protein 251 [Nilaparvata lugens]|uniref:cilia- and flagella-associated protein 251 n=1 Tax=Nilaparvata lugens TaxID=108931 RepID=UPI00193D3965|nr:cilia- and flagella-associated protein 251 [Nilaparvata lugens]